MIKNEFKNILFNHILNKINSWDIRRKKHGLYRIKETSKYSLRYDSYNGSLVKINKETSIIKKISNVNYILELLTDSKDKLSLINNIEKNDINIFKLYWEKMVITYNSSIWIKNDLEITLLGSDFHPDLIYVKYQFSPNTNITYIPYDDNWTKISWRQYNQIKDDLRTIIKKYFDK